MSDLFPERERALENEYIRRKDQEALEKLRQRRAAAGGPERAAAARQCPLGHGALVEVAIEDVFIDRCEQCQGVWLDAGELEQLMEKGQISWLRILWPNRPAGDSHGGHE